MSHYASTSTTGAGPSSPFNTNATPMNSIHGMPPPMGGMQLPPPPHQNGPSLSHSQMNDSSSSLYGAPPPPQQQQQQQNPSMHFGSNSPAPPQGMPGSGMGMAGMGMGMGMPGGGMGGGGSGLGMVRVPSGGGPMPHPHQQQQQQQQMQQQQQQQHQQQQHLQHQQQYQQLAQAHQAQQQQMMQNVGLNNGNGSGNVLASPNGSVPMMNGHSNGYDSGYAPSLASSSSGIKHQPDPEHAIRISQRLFTEGFHQGKYSDVELSIRGRPYRLHRLILSRSPLLAYYIDNHPPSMVIDVQVFDDSITDESIALALGYLYSSNPIDMIYPGNARACLAAASFLGMPDMADHAYEVCKRSINADTIVEWVEWCESTSVPAAGSAQHSQSNSGSQLGMMQQQGQGGQQVFGNMGMGGAMMRPFSPNGSEMATRGTSPSPVPGMVFGNGGLGNGVGSPVEESVPDWRSRLRTDIHNYIAQSLPAELQAHPLTPEVPLSQDPRYLNIFAHLPFDLFKSLVEDPSLIIKSGPAPTGDQERFTFAKRCIQVRKKRAAAVLAANPNAPPAPVENVVLQIGANGHQVHITRKSRARTLWKVGGNE